MPIDIPEDWARINIGGLSGTIMVIGGTDVGKSSFARFLYHQLVDLRCRAAFLDGDPGQSFLGPPGTMTAIMESNLGVDEKPKQGAFNADRCWRSFVGAVTPRGHMLPILTGCNRLLRAVHLHGATTVVYDTCGFIDPTQGGHSLKLAKIDLLCPETIIAIQREDELERLLHPLRRSHRTRVITLQPSPSAIRRLPAERQVHRAEMFRKYFSNSKIVSNAWSKIAVFPYPRFILNRLLAFEDLNGCVLALGIITGIDQVKKRLDILTPLEDDQYLDAIHLGDIKVDPVSFRDETI